MILVAQSVLVSTCQKDSNLGQNIKLCECLRFASSLAVSCVSFHVMTFQ